MACRRAQNSPSIQPRKFRNVPDNNSKGEYSIMFGRILSGLFVAAALAIATPAFAGADDWVGHWVNSNLSTANLVSIDITKPGANLRVHPWGKCTPTPCDWGTVNATVPPSGINYQAVFNPGFKTATLRLILSPDHNRLTVINQTVFTDGSGRAPYSTTEVFRRE